MDCEENARVILFVLLHSLLKEYNRKAQDNVFLTTYKSIQGTKATMKNLPR